MPQIRRRSHRAIACWTLLAGLLSFAPMPRAWNADRMAAAAQQHGAKAVAGLRALQPLLVASADPEERLHLQEINEFFNRRILFREDLEVWGQVDYWASPFEMFEKGAGDCEDFAVAKYFSLLAAGVAAPKLRLVYVRAQIGGPGGAVQAHMVLAYYPTPTAEPLILDNLITEVRPAGRRRDLTPVFSFNAEGIWEGVGGVAVAGTAAERLSRWRDVLSRSLQDGFQ